MMRARRLHQGKEQQESQGHPDCVQKTLIYEMQSLGKKQMAVTLWCLLMDVAYL